jgi:hypothetical protein
MRYLLRDLVTAGRTVLGEARKKFEDQVINKLDEMKAYIHDGLNKEPAGDNSLLLPKKKAVLEN